MKHRNSRGTRQFQFFLMDPAPRNTCRGAHSLMGASYSTQVFELERRLSTMAQNYGLMGTLEIRSRCWSAWSRPSGQTPRVRVPRAFRACQAGGWRSRRSRSRRCRGQEGGLEVTLRKKKTGRKVGHEGRINVKRGDTVRNT